jgi:hypothetical protein
MNTTFLYSASAGVARKKTRATDKMALLNRVLTASRILQNTKYVVYFAEFAPISARQRDLVSRGIRLPNTRELDRLPVERS